MKEALSFFPFNFFYGHGMEPKVLGNDSKLYGHMIYVLYKQPFWILTVGSKLKWLQIEVVVNQFTFWPFVYILAIGLGWNNFKCLHKIVCHKNSYKYYNYF